MTLAIVFPGQGSQSVGMLNALAQDNAVVAEVFTQASDALGYDLWDVVHQGPEERLNQTAVTQPAMLASGYAVWQAWQSRGGPRPALLAGHSLGEYTALVCAGVLQFGDAIRIVAERGRLMQEAVPAGVGAMAAILGLEDAQVQSVCEQAAQGEVVQAVNFNSPGQVVIAGQKDAVARAMQLAKEQGAKRALPLPVSVPSHCALMESAAAQLADYLTRFEFATPTIPVLHNADVAGYDAADQIRDALKRQLYSPVRWVETIRHMAAQGVTRVVECGPGKVLTGLNKRIDNTLQALAAYDAESIRQAIES